MNKVQLAQIIALWTKQVQKCRSKIALNNERAATVLDKSWVYDWQLNAYAWECRMLCYQTWAMKLSLILLFPE